MDSWCCNTITTHFFTINKIALVISQYATSTITGDLSATNVIYFWRYVSLVEIWVPVLGKTIETVRDKNPNNNNKLLPFKNTVISTHTFSNWKQIYFDCETYSYAR